MDFLVQEGNVVIPVEVKSGEVVRSASLRYYARKYPEETPLRLRLSMRNLSCDDGLLNVPLYMAEHALRLAKRDSSRNGLAKRYSDKSGSRNEIPTGGPLAKRNPASVE